MSGTPDGKSARYDFYDRPTPQRDLSRLRWEGSNPTATSEYYRSKGDVFTLFDRARCIGASYNHYSFGTLRYERTDWFCQIRHVWLVCSSLVRYGWVETQWCWSLLRSMERSSVAVGSCSGRECHCSWCLYSSKVDMGRFVSCCVITKRIRDYNGLQRSFSHIRMDIISRSSQIINRWCQSFTRLRHFQRWRLHACRDMQCFYPDLTNGADQFLSATLIS